MSNDKAAATWHPYDIPPHRVYCGSTNVIIAEVTGEATAVAAAIDHEVVHACGTWWERPLDHVAFYAPNVKDPPGRRP